jgi:hypothetical protein
MQILTETAVAEDAELIAPLFAWPYNGVPVGSDWTAGRNNAEWGSDYVSRVATRSRTCMRTGPKRPRTSTPTSTALGSHFTVRTPTLSPSPRARHHR